MSQVASFDDFLQASARLAGRMTEQDGAIEKSGAVGRSLGTSIGRTVKQPGSSSKKVKVGLTVDADIVDAIDDYIYYERKQGRRLKKNDVYEAALRQFLGLEGDDAR